MRLFIAINFNDDIKEELENNIEDLKDEAKRGNFSLIDNLHLTLAFIGELDKRNLQTVKDAMIYAVSNFEYGPFEILLGDFGRFKGRRGGEYLYWRGLAKSEELNVLQRSIVRQLAYLDIPVDEKPFKPHITLARSCVLYEDFDEEYYCDGLFDESMTVKSIELMQSEVINGRTVYTTIYSLKI